MWQMDSNRERRLQSSRRSDGACPLVHSCKRGYVSSQRFVTFPSSAVTSMTDSSVQSLSRHFSRMAVLSWKQPWPMRESERREWVALSQWRPAARGQLQTFDRDLGRTFERRLCFENRRQNAPALLQTRVHFAVSRLGHFGDQAVPFFAEKPRVRQSPISTES